MKFAETKILVPTNSISLSTLERVVKKENFRYKAFGTLKPNSGTDKSKRERRFVSERCEDYLAAGYSMIFIDETSWNLQKMHLNKGWGHRGVKVKQRVPEKSKNYTLLCGISARGIEAAQIVKGPVKAVDFWYFVDQLLSGLKRELGPERILEEKSKDRMVIEMEPESRKWALFLDNAPIHKGWLKQKFEKLVPILFSAPYSPDLNPIEGFFGDLKRKVKENMQGQEFTEKSLLEQIQRQIVQYPKRNVASFIYGSLKFVMKGIRMEDYHLIKGQKN